MARGRRVQYDPTVGARFNREDRQKLQQLCTAMQRPVSEVLRILVRLAQPTGLQAVWFPPPQEPGGQV
jgi:hypothetical protein